MRILSVKKICLGALIAAFVFLLIVYFQRTYRSSESELDLYGLKEQLFGNKLGYRGIRKNSIPNDSNFTAPLRVYVFEEHHEVLQAWFKHTSPDQTYAVIHIDSHSDIAPPVIPELDFKFGERPTNYKEIRSLMQINDNFIVGAISTGMIDRVGYVHPLSTEPSDLSTVEFLIGKARYRSVWTGCVCERNDKSELLCEIMIRDGDSVEIPTSRCYKIDRKYLFTEGNPRQMVKKLVVSNSTFLLENQPLILDIDEDYFGVELPATDLFESGFSTKSLALLDSLINTIFCPRRVEGEEKLVDSWFTGFIDALHNHCRIRQIRCPPFPIIFTKYVSPFIRRNLKILCIQDEPAYVYFEKIWNFLSRLTRSQLHHVRQLGVCYSISPLGKSEFISQFGFRLCAGANLPNNSAVQPHTRTANQLDQDFQDLEVLLRELPRPSLVTLCRSSRDGYVPRKQQADIERRILRMLTKLYQIDGKNNIIYDRFLAGGIKGWFNRLSDQSIL